MAKILDFELNDQDAAEMAAQWRRQIDVQERKVADWFAPPKQAAFKAHAIICRQERNTLAPYREARRILNAKLATWQEQRSSEAGGGELQNFGVQSELDRTVISTLPTVHSSRVEGISFRENWRAEVVDKLAFVAAVAARPELINLIDPNLAALSHLARAQKNALEIPGVRIWRERTVVASRS